MILTLATLLISDVAAELTHPQIFKLAEQSLPNNDFQLQSMRAYAQIGKDLEITVLVSSPHAHPYSFEYRGVKTDSIPY